MKKLKQNKELWDLFTRREEYSPLLSDQYTSIQGINDLTAGRRRIHVNATITKIFWQRRTGFHCDLYEKKLHLLEQ